MAPGDGFLRRSVAPWGSAHSSASPAPGAAGSAVWVRPGSGQWGRPLRRGCGPPEALWAVGQRVRARALLTPGVPPAPRGSLALWGLSPWGPTRRAAGSFWGLRLVSPLGPPGAQLLGPFADCLGTTTCEVFAPETFESQTDRTGALVPNSLFLAEKPNQDGGGRVLYGVKSPWCQHCPRGPGPGVARLGCWALARSALARGPVSAPECPRGGSLPCPHVQAPRGCHAWGPRGAWRALGVR